MRRQLVVGMLLLGTGVAAWCAPGAGARAAYFARTTADEPQYLLSALSLAEDASLDISDERAEERFRDFHEAGLPVQEEVQDDGSMVSPHDPLLPVLLALPMGLGGWLAAKLALALLAGALAAAMLWVAVRRFAVPFGVAIVCVAAFSLAAPLAVYGTQVYPELTAALAVTIAIGALTGPLGRTGLLTLGASVVALPWLSVKYAPVAVALVAVAAWRVWQRGDRRTVAIAGGALAAAALVYFVVHQLVYGGWTVYAAGDHFVGGELTVSGTDPDYLGRTVRLLGLLVDRHFGLAAWQPAFLLGVPALAALAVRRPAGWPALVLPLAAGWLNATFVALTMHGWWWPGRQVVVVVPCIVLAVAWWAGQHRAAFRWVAAGLGTGAVIYAWLTVDVLRGHLRLIVDFERISNPVIRFWQSLMPVGVREPAGTDLLRVAWLAVVVGLVVWGVRSMRARPQIDPVIPGIPDLAPPPEPAAVASPSAAGGARSLRGRPMDSVTATKGSDT